MISLNLLPSLDKTRAQQTVYFLVALRYTITTLSLLMLVTAYFFLNQYLVQREISRIDADIEAASSATAVAQGGSLQENIKRVNTRLRTLQEVQAGFTPWSSFIADFLDSTPAGIVLTSFSADVRTRTVQIQGIASTRADLLAYRDQMKESRYLESSNLPISDLTLRANIEFQLSGVLKPSFWQLALQQTP